jgi:hypothetical protein
MTSADSLSLSTHDICFTWISAFGEPGIRRGILKSRLAPHFNRVRLQQFHLTATREPEDLSTHL